jgi:hypothetical protein
MTKAVLFIFLALLPNLGFSQAASEKAAASDRVTKIVRVRYGNAEAIGNLVRPGASANLQANNALKAIVITGKPADVASAEQAIRELDTPSSTPNSKDVELLVYVVGASNRPEPAAGAQNSEAITAVLKQLRSIFPYKNYELLSTMLLRSHEGAAASNMGVMKSFADPSGGASPSTYSIHYGKAAVSSEGSRPSVHIMDFGFRLWVPLPVGSSRPPNTSAPGSVPTQMQNFTIAIQSSVDLQEGQKVVVGKSNIDSSDSTLFVVLTAKLVD